MTDEITVKTIINMFALMEMGMVETAAKRIAKQFEEKCAEIARLRTALDEISRMSEFPDEFDIGGASYVAEEALRVKET